MNWFTTLFSGGVSEVVTGVGDAIDSIVTSDEERLLLKNAFEKEMNNFKTNQLKHVENMEQQITDRHKVDMQSDSWLSKNIRPLVLAFLTASTIFLAYLTIFVDLTELQITSLNSWIPLLQVLLTSCYIFFFGGRSIEKLKGVAGKVKDKATSKNKI